MSEAGWGTDHLEPQKPPRRVPVWVWACGSGCLLTMVALAVAGFLGFRFLSKLADPDVQWPKLARVLPFDEPPPPLRILGSPAISGNQVWILTTRDGRTQGMLWHVTEDVEEFRAEFLEPEHGEQDLPLLGKIGVFSPEKGMARIQGRELPYLRSQSFPPGSEPEVDEQREVQEGEPPGFLEEVRRAAHATAIQVDLRPESTGSGLFLRLTKPRSREPVTDEELRQFLEPFHVGPER